MNKSEPMKIAMVAGTCVIGLFHWISHPAFGQDSMAANVRHVLATNSPGEGVSGVPSAPLLRSEPAWANPAVPPRDLDREFGFPVLVWQYQTNAIRDRELYQQLNLHGWHIDYGEGQSKSVAFAIENRWPYYVDHGAGKGILHLTPASGLNSIATDGSESSRPWPLLAEATWVELASRIDANLKDVSGGPVIGVALDDEVSLGAFNSPLEVDFSEGSIQTFRQWLGQQYPDEASLRAAWGEAASGFASAVPGTYETVRNQIELPCSQWRLARWLDFRSFNDSTMSLTLASLVRYAHHVAAGAPVGVVGGHQPSVYSGFDYSQIRHAVQWIESYDIGGTNELLRSFWSATPRKPRLMTFFAKGDRLSDQWFLWYYLAHGCRGVIAWPETQGRPWFEQGKINPAIQALQSTFAEIQSPELAVLAHPETEPVFSPIAILYSHPSIQVGWAIDASSHGKTWPRRSSSLDNDNLSSGKNRVAWSRLFEDLGHQPRFIDANELKQGVLGQLQVRLLVLGQAFALSPQECAAIKRFVADGGLVVADYGAAITDQHGTGYSRSPLDELFGIDRREDLGWFDGQRRFEIDGEKYQRPLVERLPGPGCLENGGWPIAERKLASTDLRNPFGAGQAIYVNQSPTAYFDAGWRAGVFGETWRKRATEWMAQIGLTEPVVIERVDGRPYGVELLRYRLNPQHEVWAIVTNPTVTAAIDGPGAGLSLEQGPISIRLHTERSLIGLSNLRTGEVVETTTPIQLTLLPSEAVILEARYSDR